jgi:hypothetical protein
VTVALRRFPFPYRACLALCNDADMMTEQSFRLLHRFLNTTHDTPLGRGLGLPIADSFFVYSSPGGPNTFTLFDGLGSQLSPVADLIRDGVRGGLIDTLHTYGAFTDTGHFTRDLARRAIDALERREMFVKVWVNHGPPSNVQCIGLRHQPHFQGDRPGTAAYHTDLTLRYGIEFCWTGRELSDVVGHDPERRLPLLVDQVAAGWRHLVQRRPGLRASQGRRLLRRLRLLDGGELLAFRRYAGTNGFTPVVEDLPAQLSAENLQRLRTRGGWAIVYQHLAVRRKAKGYGVGSYQENPPPYLQAPERAAFERLAESYHAGDILVTSTERALRLNRLQRWLQWHAETVGQRTRIVLSGLDQPSGKRRLLSLRDLQGTTFYTSRPGDTELWVETEGTRQQVKDVLERPPDHTGRASIMVPLPAPAVPEL